MLTEAQKRAKGKYKASIKRFTVDFTPKEQDIYEHLLKQPNKQSYIKELIRADMKRK